MTQKKEKEYERNFILKHANLINVASIKVIVKKAEKVRSPKRNDDYLHPSYFGNSSLYVQV